MASAGDWIEGARLRTLPAAVSTVVAGTAVALFERSADVVLALLALVVALALQVGVNYANDYSDGIRGTDEKRVGPMRLVGSGAAEPGQVKAAAFGCFGLAALAGLAIVILTGHWWLIVVGLASIAAAWYYTGGKRPYGYAGLGEVFVFVFFGLVAVGGTVYIQTGRVSLAAWLVAIAMGALSCAVLTANNLRDIANDALVGKHTLPTRLGDARTRILFVVLIGVAVGCLAWVAGLTTWWALLAWAGCIFWAGAVRTVLAGATGMTLVRVLRLVGFGQLAAAVGLLIGMLIGR